MNDDLIAEVENTYLSNELTAEGRDLLSRISTRLRTDAAALEQLTAERDEHKRWRANLADKLHDRDSEIIALLTKRDALAARVKEAEGLLLRARAAFKHVGVVRGIDEWCDELDAFLAADAKPGSDGSDG